MGGEGKDCYLPISAEIWTQNRALWTQERLNGCPPTARGTHKQPFRFPRHLSSFSFLARGFCMFRRFIAARRQSPLTWPTVVGVSVVGGAALAYYRVRASEQTQQSQVKSAGTAAIGGPFSVVRDDG